MGLLVKFIAAEDKKETSYEKSTETVSSFV